MNVMVNLKDIGIKKEIELAADITAGHYKRLIAVLFIDNNDVTYKVIVDGDTKLIVSNVYEALDAFNSIYLRQM
jgi:hypothetical protein